MELREQAIHLAQSMLATVPFNNVYSYADNLCDLKEMRLGDPALAKQVDFLKNTTLSQVDFEDLEDPALFTLKNRDTKKTIEVSNRESSRGEIRGHVLRLILEQERKKHPSKSLFDVISEALKDPQYSDMIVMMRGALTGDVVKPLYNGESMTKVHFDAFQNAVLSAIQHKIETGQIPADLNPIDIRRNDEVRERVTSGIDFGVLYDLSQRFSEEKWTASGSKTATSETSSLRQYAISLAENSFIRVSLNPAISPKSTMASIKRQLTSTHFKPLYNEKPMTEAHFDAFQQMALSAIQRKVETYKTLAGVTSIGTEKHAAIKSIIQSGTDFGALYDLSQLMPKFSRHIEQLEEKAEHLRVRGYEHEAGLAQALAKNLSGEQDKLMRGKSSPQEFVNHTKAQINEAKDAGLGNLRGVGRVFFPILNGILNVLTSVCTLGLANIATGRLSIFSKSSDAGQKIEKIEQEIGENTLGKTGP